MNTTIDNDENNSGNTDHATCDEINRGDEHNDVKEENNSGAEHHDANDEDDSGDEGHTTNEIEILESIGARFLDFQNVQLLVTSTAAVHKKARWWKIRESVGDDFWEAASEDWLMSIEAGIDERSDDEQDLLDQCSLPYLLTWSLIACELWSKTEGSDYRRKCLVLLGACEGVREGVTAALLRDISWNVCACTELNGQGCRERDGHYT